MKSGEYGLSQPQWAELERLVREGGSRPVEFNAPFDGPYADWVPRPGRDAGRRDTFRALSRRDYIEIRFDPDAPETTSDPLPCRISITHEGRAALAAHRARRGHPVPTDWRRRPKSPTVRNLARGLMAAMSR